MGAFKKTVIAVSVTAVYGWLGAADYADALILDAIEKKARPARVVARDKALPFAHPIPYRTVVCQSDYGEKPTCVFYAERTK